jgi:hypothetical protein
MDCLADYVRDMLATLDVGGLRQQLHVAAIRQWQKEALIHPIYQ